MEWPLLLLILVVSGLIGAAAAESESFQTQDHESEMYEGGPWHEIPPLEEIMKWTVQTPSRFPQTLSEAPSSVTIVTSEEVKKYGYRTLADLLRSVRGLYVTDNRVDSFLGVRGFNRGDFNSRVLVMIDGHRINNSLTDGAAIGNGFLLDVDLIDRVEVVRGPGSALYGNNAFFGVINVISRDGSDFSKRGFEISGEAGNLNTYKGRLSFGRKFDNGVNVLLSGTYYTSDGQDTLYFPEFDDPLNNHGVARDLDGTEVDSFFGSINYKSLTLQGGFVDRSQGIPTAPENSEFNDPEAMNDEKRSYVNLRWVEELGWDLNLMANVYYDRSEFSRDLLVGAFRSQETQIGDWWGAELQLTREFFNAHKVTVGAEYRDDFRQEAEIQSEDPTFVPANVMRSRKNYGIYINGDFALYTNVVHLNAGVRYDQYPDLDSSVNPRIALIYQPVESSVFKAIYGTAFRAPNFRELIDPRFMDIGAEDITSYELVYEQMLGRNLRSTLDGFYNRIDNLIVFENGAFGNVDADGIGFEAGLEAIWTNGWRARVSYTFQEVTRQDTGQILTDVPRHLAKINFVVPLYKDKIFGGLEYQFVSRRQTERTLFVGGAQTVPGPEVPGYGVLNLNLFSQNLLDGLELSAGVYNVLNKQYYDPSTPGHFQASIPQDGRTFRIKLTYHF